MTPLLWSGLALADCPPPPVAIEDVRRLVEEQRDVLAPVRFATWLEENTDCVDVLVTREDLAELYHFAGTVSQNADPEEARRLFVTGAVLAGCVPIDPTLGAPAVEGWEAACRDAAARPRGWIEARGRVWVDGEALAGGHEREVTEGWHLVQRRTRDGVVLTERVEVAGGQRLQVGSLGSPGPASLERSPAQLPLIASGALLVAGGSAMLGGFYFLHEKDHNTPEPVSGRTLGILYGGGLLAVGVGGGALVVGGLLSDDAPGFATTINLHW